jgi:hypothetical protein
MRDVAFYNRASATAHGPTWVRSPWHLPCNLEVEEIWRWTMNVGKPVLRKPADPADRQREGAVGWILLWLIGIPIPILLVFFLLRGCT